MLDVHRLRVLRTVVATGSVGAQDTEAVHVEHGPDHTVALNESEATIACADVFGPSTMDR